MPTKFYHRIKTEDIYLYGPVLPWNKALEDDNAVLLFDRLDQAMRSYPFEDLFNNLDDPHLIHLKNKPNVRLLINFCDDYFNLPVVRDFRRRIKEWQIPGNKIVFVVKDQMFRKFCQRIFSDVPDIEFILYSPLQVRCKNVDTSELTERTKFNILSRNFNEDRFELYLKLVDKDLLKHFSYSFHNLNPYETGFDGNYFRYPIQTLLDMAREMGYGKPACESWITSIPYEINETSHFKTGRLSKFGPIVPRAIASADFHIVVESHYHPYKNYNHAEILHNEGKLKVHEFSPSFATEKFYKAIMAETPHLVHTTPRFLEELKLCGYESFSPWIDETYDTIYDPAERLDAIVAEVGRICALPESSYNQVVAECNAIQLRNKRTLIAQNRVDYQAYRDKYGDWFVDFSAYCNSLNEKDYISDLDIHMQGNFWRDGAKSPNLVPYNVLKPEDVPKNF